MLLSSRAAAFALLVVTQIMAMTPPAAAAEPASGTLTPVVVTTAAGGSLQGTLLELGPESLSLLTRKQETPVTIPLVDIERIQTARDSSRDGAIKGALTFGLLCMIACAEGSRSRAEYWGTVLGNAVLGGGIGWGLDALVVSHATIYERNGRRLAIGARYRW